MKKLQRCTNEYCSDKAVAHGLCKNCVNTAYYWEGKPLAHKMKHKRGMIRRQGVINLLTNVRDMRKVK